MFWNNILFLFYFSMFKFKVTTPLLGKGLVAHREGSSTDHHFFIYDGLTKRDDNKLNESKTNCLGSLVVLSATATLEVLGSIPTSSKKCYWVFLWNSQ